MDSLFDSIRSTFADGDAQRIMLVGAIAVAAFLFALGVALVTSWATDPIRRRLGDVAPSPSIANPWAARVNAWLAPVRRYVMPTKAAEQDSVQRRLSYAGFRSTNAAPVFYAIKTALALAFPLAWLAVAGLLPTVTSSQVLIYAIFASFTGLMIPNYVLSKFVQRRQKQLRDGFPDALDMLVVCVESGLGLAPAIQRVADEIAVSHPELAGELALVNAEIRAGVERDAALRNLADRTGLEDIRGLVSLLIQTMKFGTSIADSLRVYSEEFRDKRMQRAEEQAAKIGTKLIFPLVLCLFPSFFLVAIGPAVIRLIEVFSQLGTDVVK